MMSSSNKREREESTTKDGIEEIEGTEERETSNKTDDDAHGNDHDDLDDGDDHEEKDMSGVSTTNTHGEVEAPVGDQDDDENVVETKATGDSDATHDNDGERDEKRAKRSQ